MCIYDKLPQEIKEKYEFKEGDRPDTLYPTSLKPAPCPDCGKNVKQRSVEYTWMYKPVVDWRARCTACRCYAHPETGEFVIATNSEFLATYLNKR